MTDKLTVLCIVKDKRRALYCARMLKLHCRPGSEGYTYGDAVLRNGGVSDHDHAWALEKLYRRLVLKQRVL